MRGQNLTDPLFVIFWHEIGHAYYGGVLKLAEQAFKAIDLENMVRQINGLDLRHYIYAL